MKRYHALMLLLVAAIAIADQQIIVDTRTGQQSVVSYTPDPNQVAIDQAAAAARAVERAAAGQDTSTASQRYAAARAALKLSLQAADDFAPDPGTPTPTAAQVRDYAVQQARRDQVIFLWLLAQQQIDARAAGAQLTPEPTWTPTVTPTPSPTATPTPSGQGAAPAGAGKEKKT